MYLQSWRHSIVAMNAFPTPRVIVSRCLEFEKVRYNGQMISDPVVSQLKSHVEFITVCPEVAIGLGVPRDPVRVVQIGDENKLIQPSTDRDLTHDMNTFANDYLSQVEHVDGFILKHSSPSCGIANAKIFNGTKQNAAPKRGNGLFADAVLNKFDGLAIEDEGRLKNFRIREHFFTKLFTLARLRQLKESSSMKSMIEFQQNHKYLFMAYSQAGLRRLGSIVAHQEKNNFHDVLQKYEIEMKKLLSKPPRYTSVINALYHIFGGVSKQLNKREKIFFEQRIQEYRDEKVPLSTLSLLLESWAIRFEDEFLLNQIFFEPFPRELVAITDSGKGRDY